MILIGVAINAIFTGLTELFNMANPSSLTSSLSVTMSTLTMNTWADVKVISLYGVIGLMIAFILFSWCNHLGLEAKTLQNLDRQTTRLNSSHVAISYAVFCFK